MARSTLIEARPFVWSRESVCGIVGYVGRHEAWPIIFEGLRRLEYRGYDSAGIAIIDTQGDIQLRKTVGRVHDLVGDGTLADPEGYVGLGHTRWATHGRPSNENAHPHDDCHGRIAVVHNGIVENYRALKETLEKDGVKFESETATEVLAHLIAALLRAPHLLGQFDDVRRLEQARRGDRRAQRCVDGLLVGEAGGRVLAALAAPGTQMGGCGFCTGTIQGLTTLKL